METTKYEIQIKGFKHAAFASQETLCFTATVYINGKKVGHADNAGHGGPTHVHIAQGTDIGDLTMAEIEDKVDALTYVELQKKDDAKFIKGLKKDMTTAILFTKKGADMHGRYFIAKFHPVARPYEKTMAMLKADAEVDLILNLATDEVILKHFR
jgi:hypothetical protein